MEAVVLAACVGLLITLPFLEDQLMSSGMVLLCRGEVERAGRKLWPVLAGADDGDTLGVVPFFGSVVEAPPLILRGSSEKILPRGGDGSALRRFLREGVT